MGYKLNRSQFSYLEYLGRNTAGDSPAQNHKKAHHIILNKYWAGTTGVVCSKNRFKFIALELLKPKPELGTEQSVFDKDKVVEGKEEANEQHELILSILLES